MTSAAPDTQLEASCHCGATKLTIPDLPTVLNECRCSICFKYGALWSYHPRNKVIFTQDPTASKVSYIWGDRLLEFVHCSKCGCVTHWLNLDTSNPSAEMGVNCRMLNLDTALAIPWKVDKGPE